MKQLFLVISVLSLDLRVGVQQVLLILLCMELSGPYVVLMSELLHYT